MSDRNSSYDLDIDGNFKGIQGSISGGKITQNIHTDNSKLVTFNHTEILQISVEKITSRELIKTSPYKGLKPLNGVSQQDLV